MSPSSHVFVQGGHDGQVHSHDPSINMMTGSSGDYVRLRWSKVVNPATDYFIYTSESDQ